MNKAAAFPQFRQQKFNNAVRYYTKSYEPDGVRLLVIRASGHLLYGVGDRAAALEAARVTLGRCEQVLAQDRNNGAAMGHGSIALAVLGQAERAKEWMNRALLVDPDNVDMRYNFACAFAIHLKDNDGAIEMLRPILAKVARAFVNYAKIDPDLEPIRGDPRFKAMIAQAEARLAG